ncbi:MAG: hypothetical protein V1834_04275 [Candidatus Micrarchaeota archaeon]
MPVSAREQRFNNVFKEASASLERARQTVRSDKGVARDHLISAFKDVKYLETMNASRPELDALKNDIMSFRMLHSDLPVIEIKDYTKAGSIKKEQVKVDELGLMRIKYARDVPSFRDWFYWFRPKIKFKERKRLDTLPEETKEKLYGKTLGPVRHSAKDAEITHKQLSKLADLVYAALHKGKTRPLFQH